MRRPRTTLLTHLSFLLQDRVKRGELNQSQGIALVAKLDAALTQLDKGNEIAGMNQLRLSPTR